MRKYLITTLILSMFLTSCSSQAKEKAVDKKTVTTKNTDSRTKSDLSKLVFKTELTEEEQIYFQNRSNEFNERARQYAIDYGPKSTPEDSKMRTEEFCKWTVDNINNLSKQPISKERERELEREWYFYTWQCEKRENHHFEFSIPEGYWEQVAKELPDSAQPLSEKAREDLRQESKRGIYKPSKEPYNLLKEAIAKDPEDLLPYVYLINWYTQTPQEKSFEKMLQEDYKEYCRKAVELKQWDHIYYLSEGEPSGMTRGVEYIMRCLETKPDEYNYKYCKCPEATRMVVSQWPKHALYSGYLLNPSGEDGNGNLREGAIDFVNDLMKKYFGRDLTKEPKVYYYKGDPGR